MSSDCQKLTSTLQEIIYLVREQKQLEKASNFSAALDICAEIDQIIAETYFLTETKLESNLNLDNFVETSCFEMEAESSNHFASFAKIRGGNLFVDQIGSVPRILEEESPGKFITRKELPVSGMTNARPAGENKILLTEGNALYMVNVDDLERVPLFPNRIANIKATSRNWALVSLWDRETNKTDLIVIDNNKGRVIFEIKEKVPAYNSFAISQSKAQVVFITGEYINVLDLNENKVVKRELVDSLPGMSEVDLGTTARISFSPGEEFLLAIIGGEGYALDSENFELKKKISPDGSRLGSRIGTNGSILMDKGRLIYREVFLHSAKVHIYEEKKDEK
ncbi:MAG: hypothetical protein NTW50_05190 [Candidatus Berkelbacteria bacterium]|nr:hypothetical protein [Candidatus Berkelbacteria bacterium]